MLSPQTATMWETKFLLNSSGKRFINRLRSGREQESDQRGPQREMSPGWSERDGGAEEGLLEVRLQVIYRWVKEGKKTTWWQKSPNIQNIRELYKFQFWLLYSSFNHLNTEEWTLLREGRCYGKINWKKKNLDTFSQRWFQRCTNHIIIFWKPQRLSANKHFIVQQVMQRQKLNSWTLEYLNAFDFIKTITTMTGTVYMDTYFIYKEERRMSCVTNVNLNIK